MPCFIIASNANDYILEKAKKVVMDKAALLKNNDLVKLFLVIMKCVMHLSLNSFPYIFYIILYIIHLL